MYETQRPLKLLAATFVAVAVFGVRPIMAQEALPAVLPEVLFLIEDSSRMADNWDGDATLSSPDSRWSYVKAAIAQVIQNAPVGMTFGVAMTADGTNDSTQANELLYGFEPVAYPGSSTATIVAQMNAHISSSNGERTFAESYADLLDNWAEENYLSPRSWAGGPFQYSCSELIVIIVGSEAGNGDYSPTSGYMTSDLLSGGYTCTDVSSNEACYGDNVADYAYNTFSPPLAGTGSVKTYSLLIDSASATISADAASYFQTIATKGSGLYYAATVPGALQTSIWHILTDTFEGNYSNASVSATSAGDMLFASFFEVEAGHPLYKGHLLGWNVDNDPTSSTFGQIIDGGGTYGEAWDAGQMLASRVAEAGTLAVNSDGGLAWTTERTGYTAASAEEFYSTLLPFDYTSVGTGTDLTTLLVDEVPVTSNEACLPLTYDFDFDCDSDWEDALLLVEFIRGHSESVFLNTGLPRGPWKMGDTGHSQAVPAPNIIEGASTEGHFNLFMQRVDGLPSFTYVSSNAGMVHAFTLEDTGNQGAEAWFYVPRSKATKDPSGSGTEEYDGYQIDDLMRSGQTFVNEGKLVLDYVWLDGYLTGLPAADENTSLCSTGTNACSGPGYFPGSDDGAIDPCGCEWHRVLVWSGGYGARHNYAVDVTIPDEPKFLWERNDTNGNTGPGKGRATSTPAVGPFWDNTSSDGVKRRWLVFWGAGEQSPGVTTSSSASQRVHASVFIHDIDTTGARTPTDYDTQGYRIPKTTSHPSANVTDSDSDGYEEYGVSGTSLIKGLFGTPTLVDYDGDASVDAAYIGDSLGYLFKVSFSPGTPTAPDRCLFASPDFANDNARHIWYRPSVFFSQGGGVLVYYGSGSPHNIYSTDQGGLYVRADGNPFGCTASTPAPCAASSSLFDNATGFMQFPEVGEKLVGDPIAAFGRLFFTTHAPGSDPCVLGNSYIYGLNVETCGGGIPDVASDGHDQDSTGMKTEVEGLISAPVFANGRIYALNIDSGGLDTDSMIDDLQVVPANFTSGQFTFSSFRHVF